MIRKLTKLLGISFLLLQLGDIATTWIGINYCGAIELNPIMAPIVNTWLMPIIKVGVGITLPVSALWMLNKYHDLLWRVGVIIAITPAIMVSLAVLISNSKQLTLIWQMR